MLNKNEYCYLLQSRLYRLLFLLFLVLFTIYPILDAYADSFNCAPANMDVVDDSFNASELMSRGHHTSTPFNGLFLPVSALVVNSAFTISRKEIPFNEIKCHHSSPPLPSDLSPPFV
jgi:hypothetical protein